MMVVTLAPPRNVPVKRASPVWGGVRTGAATGGPKGRYCANLGHVQDDESGLIYMRARYYEPSTGRFISEDPAMDGSNWYVYCNSNPLRFVDDSGKTTRNQILAAMLVAFLLVTQYSTDGSQVETAYGIFMVAVNFSVLHHLLPDSLADFLDIMPATYLMTSGFSIGSMLGGPVGAAIGAAIGAVLMTLEYANRIKTKVIDAAMIVTAYFLRLEWYVRDIYQY